MSTHDNELDDETSSKSGKKKLIIILVLLLLLGGGGAGLFFSGLLNSVLGIEADAPKEKEDAEKTEAHADDETNTKDGKNAAPSPVYFDLPEFVANLNPGSATPSFIKMVVTIEVENQEVLTKLQAIQPKVQDTINTYLRELRPSDLKGSAGVHRLREELTLRLNKTLYPDKINNILFKELLIQ
jgi:flagellar FliL protein